MEGGLVVDGGRVSGVAMFVVEEEVERWTSMSS